MTSRSSRQNRSGCHSRAAFSLVEVLLVLALAMVLASLSAPLWSGAMERARLDADADLVRDEWARARLEAIRVGKPLVFRCAPGTPNFRLSLLEESAPGASAAPASAPATASGMRTEFATRDGSLAAARFQLLALGSPSDPQALAAAPPEGAMLVFAPAGQTQDAFAEILGQSGVRRRIVLRGLTGAAEVDHAPAVDPAAPSGAPGLDSSASAAS